MFGILSGVPGYWGWNLVRNLRVRSAPVGVASPSEQRPLSARPSEPPAVDFKQIYKYFNGHRGSWALRLEWLVNSRGLGDEESF